MTGTKTNYKNYDKYTEYTKKVLTMDSMILNFENYLYPLNFEQLELLYEDLSEKKKNEGLTDTEASILNFCILSIFDECDPDEEDRRNYYHSRDEYMYDDDDDDDGYDWDDNEEDEDEEDDEEEYDDE